MSTLRIYFSSHWRDSSSPCPWALCDESGAVLQSGTEPLPVLPKGHECIGIVAADRVLCLTSKLPSGARRRWQAALPFMAEEHTLPDPEHNHVVPGPTLADGQIMLAVVDKPWLKHIIEACRTAKLPLRRMLPETLLPTLTLASWVLVWDGNSGFIRTGPATGMALDNGDTHTAPLALRLALNEAQTALPKKIEVCFPYAIAETQRSLPQWSDLNISLAAGPVWDWRHAVIPDNTLNLLWGDFAPRAKFREWWPNLRPAAFILLAVLAVEVTGSNIEWALLANEKTNLAQNMERSFRAAFGSSGALVNAPLQMQRNLAQLRHTAGLPDDGDFLPLLDGAAHPLTALPAGSVRALHYESGRLDMDIKLGAKADIQNLLQRLKNNGLGVRVSDIHDAGNGVEARLTVLPEAE